MNIEITKDIYTAHKKLSTCSADFLEFTRRHPESLARSNFNTLLKDGRFNYFYSQPWPTFINETTKNGIKEAAEKVLNLIKSIPDRLFSFDHSKISDYYEIPRDKVAFIFYGVNQDYIDHLLGRGDFVFSLSSQWKCIEFNMQSNLGGWELDFLEPLYIDTPVIAKFLKEYRVQLHYRQFFPLLFDFLIQRALKHFDYNGQKVINLAIVYPDSFPENESPMMKRLKDQYHHVMCQIGNGLNGDLVACNFEQLHLGNGFVTLAGKKIHYIIEMNNGVVPFMLMDSVKNKKLLLNNGPIAEIMSNKLNLALLSEHQDSDIFSSEERESIGRYIPWTRKMTAGETSYAKEKVRLEDFVISNRERLVVKPSRGYGGKNVYIGAYSSPREWNERVNRAFDQRKWVVQEYIPSFSYMYQWEEEGCAEHRVVFGFFIFGSSYAGGFVRMKPARKYTGVINSLQGAEESILLEVKE
jgi:glutathionylspermidine synthase